MTGKSTKFKRLTKSGAADSASIATITIQSENHLATFKNCLLVPKIKMDKWLNGNHLTQRWSCYLLELSFTQLSVHGWASEEDTVG